MRDDLRKNDDGKGFRGDEHLLERAVGEVRREHARKRQEGRKKRRHPHDARGDRTQRIRFGAHAQRHERHDDGEEEDHLSEVGLAAKRKHQVTAKNGEKELPHDFSPQTGSAFCAASSSSAASTAVRFLGDQRSGSITMRRAFSTGTS